MFEYNEQCKKCFHFQVCAQVMKNQLSIREKMPKEENPECEHFVNTADVTEVRHGEMFANMLFQDLYLTISVPTAAQKWTERGRRRMTPEEAIKTIQVAIAEVEWNYPLDYAIAFETAIKALEKQVEKNPKNEYTDNLDITTQIPVCPLCGNYDIDETDEYCYECGQKIDWRETE